MTLLPEQYRPYAAEAEALLRKKAVGAIEFSGGTYQLQLIDPDLDESLWAFLQFDIKNRLTDSFCSCEEGGEFGACVHLAAAYLIIFSNSTIPLHKRFQESLWNSLCSCFADRYGDDLKVLTHRGLGIYSLVFEEEEVFSVSGDDRIEKIFQKRDIETEETSLKFSNLSEDEIQLWRQGRPSSELRYELSFWKDLAKMLMLLQEGKEPYAIRFDYSLDGIPNKIYVDFSALSLMFVLHSEGLISIIPSFATVISPLKIYGLPEDAIEKITYNVEKGVLEIHQGSISTEKQPLLAQNHFGDWVYIPKKGFRFQGKHPLLKKKLYQGKEIADIFDQHYALIKAKLKNVKIKETSVPLCYFLYFDVLWNLHIEPFIFQPEDFRKEGAQFLGTWAFLETEGFVHLQDVLFDTAEKIIKQDDVSQFVQHNRSWFNLQKGFNTYITGVETKLSYELSHEDCLLFSRKMDIEDAAMHSKDFGFWVYIKGQGFFSKVTSDIGISIRNGTSIKREQIPSFIRLHQDELAMIPHFFSEKNPVQKVGLRLELFSPESITISPDYEISSSYVQKKVKFFEDYTFVEGEGFHRIPDTNRLPEKFQHSIQLDQSNLVSFFDFELENIKRFITWMDPRLKRVKELRIVANTLSLGPRGYTLQLQYLSKGRIVTFDIMWDALTDNRRYFFSEAGLIDLHEDRFNWIRKIAKKQFNRRKGLLTLSSLELLRLNAFDPLEVIEGRELLSELIEFRAPDEPDFSGLKSTLRSYQKIGLNWLWFLYHHQLSGLLCDDMGLGKTHQAMALMAAIKKIKSDKRHFLVVCPTSVIYHWEEKLKEFLPEFKVCTFHGAKRSLEDFHQEYDILLTSYGIWRNENAVLSQVIFEVAILDEIHSAKNQTSRIHASLLNIKACMRIGLSGTPIENRLRELKALFDLILPTYMPSETEYRKFFILPIEKDNNSDRKKLLNRFIKPFVMRRKKEDVLTDLPEKIEEISHCALSLDQQLLYNDVLNSAKSALYHELEDHQTPIPYIHIFSILSSLKQICNHPAVYLKTPENYKNYTSGKWDLFVELLNEAFESEQKVVIFSHYLSMLDIFEHYLKENDIPFASIRGATVKRGEEIRRFNQDPSCRVFVGSLHAAGLGIDLTAGSVVIHYDRWWNAAREDQATDRVHRIGQTRGVQVFKLVTKGTFEEKIDEMIARKGVLLEEVVGVDDYRFMKQLNREEILELFHTPFLS